MLRVFVHLITLTFMQAMRLRWIADDVDSASSPVACAMPPVAA